MRAAYQWNFFHSTQNPFGKMVPLSQLFDLTAFSGSIGAPTIKPTLPSEWVIDWRRFYNLPAELHYKPAPEMVSSADLVLYAQLSLSESLLLPSNSQDPRP